MSKKRSRTKTYRRQRPDGRTVRVTIPPPPTDDEQFQDALLALREQLGPHAVAAIVSCLQINRTNNDDVDRQVHWFAEQLVTLLGGYEQQNRLAEELGL